MMMMVVVVVSLHDVVYFAVDVQVDVDINGCVFVEGGMVGVVMVDA